MRFAVLSKILISFLVSAVAFSTTRDSQSASKGRSVDAFDRSISLIKNGSPSRANASSEYLALSFDENETPDKRIAYHELSSGINDYPACAPFFSSEPLLISPDYSGESRPQSYNSTVKGTISQVYSSYFNPDKRVYVQKKRKCDVDLFEFRVFGRASVELVLSNIAGGCDYDLELLSHVKNDLNIKPNDFAENKIDLIKKSTKPSNSNERIFVSDLLPNVYYARVSSPNGTFSSVKYNLRLTVNYSSKSASISELRYQYGAKGAVWVSDYDPYGYLPFQKFDEQYIGVGTLGSSASTWTNPIFSYIERFERLRHASVYVWDPELRNGMASTLRSILTQAEAKEAEMREIKEDAQVRLDMLEATLDIVMTFVFPSGGVFTFKAFFGVIRDFLIWQLIFDCLELLFVPSESSISRIETFIDYIRCAVIALECGEQTNEVVLIESYYSAKNGFLNMHTIDFTPSQSELDKSHLYGSDLLSDFDSNAFFCGTIYPLCSNDSISGLFSKTIPVLDEVNTSIPVLLSTGVREYGELDFGEYKWFGFTAETSGLFRFRMDSRSLALVGDLFNSITSGRSNEGRLAISKEDLGADAFSVDCFLQADETVYLRVRSQDWSGEGIFSVIVERVADNASDISIKSSDVVFEGSEYPEDCMSQDFFFGSETINTSRRRAKTTDGLIDLCVEWVGQEAWLEFTFQKAIRSISLLHRVIFSPEEGVISGFYYYIGAYDDDEEAYDYCPCEGQNDDFCWDVFDFSTPSNKVKLSLYAWGRGSFPCNVRALISELRFQFVA